MSTAAPRSCLKPPVRNPWVAEDGGESSTSSGQQQLSQHHPAPALDVPPETIGSSHAHHSHDLLAHQYATPYHSSASHVIAHPVSHQSHSAIYSTSGVHTVVSGARSSHNVGQQHVHGVVHSHTAHSLHSAAHALPTAAHSVHSVPGTIQQPWVDPQLLWSTPTLPGIGVGGGVFTVGGGPVEGSCPTLPPGVYPQPHPVLHSLPSLHPSGGGSSGQASSAGGAGGWGTAPLPGPYPQSHGAPSTGGGGGRNIISASENWSRCERCHYYCFRAAQAAFVAGIVTGFSLLVAGGVFHRQHIAHLQVLVYIGAMVSLVCVVLLVIFCAMNKDHRTRRGVSARFSGPHVGGGDPETVPLRPIETNNPPVIITDSVSHGGMIPGGELLHQTNHSSCIAPLPNHSSCMAVPPPTSHGVCCVPPPNQGGCVMSPSSQNMCYIGPASHSAGSVVVTANKALNSVASSESTHHNTRQAAQRMDDDRESSHRYNRLWKQPTKAPSEATSKL